MQNTRDEEKESNEAMEVGPSRDIEQKLRLAEEHKVKAIEHARTQTRKVEDLKGKLKAEQEKNATLESRTKEAETKNVYLDKAVTNLRSQLAKVSPSKSGKDMTSQQKKDYETQIAVLQQQIALFKEDFDNERKDRERAQKEVIRMREALAATKKTYTDNKQGILQRDAEIQALKDTRDRQEVTIQRLERENAKLNRRLTEVPGDQYNIHLHGGVLDVHEPHTNRQPNLSPSKYGFLTDDQKHSIRRNWETFCGNLRTDDLVTILFSEGVLSLHQKEGMDQMHTSTEKAEFLMSSVVMKGTQRDLRAFKLALVNTNQEALASLLPEARQPKVNTEEEMEHQQETNRGVTTLPWRCDLCTYENYPHRTTCAMCGHKKREYGSKPSRSHSPFRGIDQCDHIVDLQLQ